jgi:F-type H+-transporting ATPase subunit a
MNKKKIILIILVTVFIVELALALTIGKSDMSHIGEAPHKMHEVFGFTIPFHGINTGTIGITWLVMAILLLVSFFATRAMSQVPKRLQAAFELIIEGFQKLCTDTLGKRGLVFMPYVTTLFLFVLLSNWIGMIPLPHFEEPTKDLNTTLGLGIIAFLVSHLAAIRYKGFGKYIMEYFEPMITIKGMKIPNFVFMPLNVIGEIGKLVSHSFRLYGNILGGIIIMQVVSNLVYYVILPVGLNLFFGLFVGAVQAFVFAMLALTYIAVLVGDEEEEEAPQAVVQN